MSTTDDLVTPAAGVPVPPAPRTSVWHRLYHGETTFDFIGRRKIGFAISGILLLLTVGSLFTRGLNLGLDFKGGVAWEAPAKGDLTVDGAKQVLDANGVSSKDAKIQKLASTTGSSIRIEVGAQSNDKLVAVRQALADKAGGTDLQNVSITTVSSTWGSEITHKAITALIWFFVLLAIYIGIRFEIKMAVGALVAVIHDVAISVGVYSIFGFQVTPATVIAFLTILGYSLYDTIVVFDKVHDNTKRFAGRVAYSEITNLSMNQVLMRSINTSLAAVLPVLSLLIIGSLVLGAVALEEFALALLVGLVTGSYSSIFIATPVLAMLKEREPKYKALRLKAAQRGGSGLTAAKIAAGGGEDATASTMVTTISPLVSTAQGLTHAPRPRKKRRR